METIYNHTGAFLIESGELIDFIPHPSNINRAGDSTELADLIFPSGITAIHTNMPSITLNHLTVRNQLIFPSTIQSLGEMKIDDEGIFSWCDLPDIILPESLKVLGNFAFGKSVISSLDILSPADFKYGRQFKGSTIDVWHVNSHITPKPGFWEDAMTMNNQKYGQIIEY